MPHVIREVCLEVRKRFEGMLGIRAHDDSGLAVANTLVSGFQLVLIRVAERGLATPPSTADMSWAV